MGSRVLAFRVVAVWCLVAGIMMMFPSVGDQVFGLHLTNWGVASELGGLLLSVGLLYGLFSMDAERYAPVLGVGAFSLVLNAAINVYWWKVGHYSMQSAGFNVLIDLPLAAWLWSLRPRRVALMGTLNTP